MSQPPTEGAALAAPVPRPAAEVQPYSSGALTRPTGGQPTVAPVEAAVEATVEQPIVVLGAAAAVAEGSVLGRAAGTLTAADRSALPAPGASPPRPGTVYHPSGRPGATARRRLTRLRVGGHTVTPAALDQIRLPAPGIGVLAGTDREQRPVLLRLFRARPTEIVLVGGVWAARLLTFRTLATGAQVVVASARPTLWHEFGRRASGGAGLETAMTEPVPLPAAAPGRPLLVVREASVGGDTVPLGPWQTRVTVYPELDRTGVAALANADLAVLQRLRPAEARHAADGLKLGPRTTEALLDLEPEMLALVGSGPHRFVHLRRTHIEQEVLGVPQR